jgi:hypothetical protein
MRAGGGEVDIRCRRRRHWSRCLQRRRRSDVERSRGLAGLTERRHGLRRPVPLRAVPADDLRMRTRNGVFGKVLLPDSSGWAI